MSDDQPSRQISSFVAHPASNLSSLPLTDDSLSTGAMNVFTQKRHTGKLSIAATSILSAVAAHAADVTAPKLMLTAYVNGAGGEKVMAGKFDEALTEIKQARY